MSGDGSSLTTNDGTWIDWKSVITVSAGVVSTSIFGGIANVIGTVFTEFVINPVSTLSKEVEDSLSNLITAPERATWASWENAGEFAQSQGPFAFVVALLIVIAAAWAFAEVRSRA